eukprot:2030888-Rhodomonas_salina.2
MHLLCDTGYPVLLSRIAGSTALPPYAPPAKYPVLTNGILLRPALRHDRGQRPEGEKACFQTAGKLLRYLPTPVLSGTKCMEIVFDFATARGHHQEIINDKGEEETLEVEVKPPFVL